MQLCSSRGYFGQCVEKEKKKEKKTKWQLGNKRTKGVVNREKREKKR